MCWPVPLPTYFVDICLTFDLTFAIGNVHTICAPFSYWVRSPYRMDIQAWPIVRPASTAAQWDTRNVYLRVHCLCVGSLQAAVDLMQKLNAVVLQCVVVVELLSLDGRSRVAADVFALISQWLCYHWFMVRYICYRLMYNCYTQHVQCHTVIDFCYKWQCICKYGAYVPNHCLQI